VTTSQSYTGAQSLSPSAGNTIQESDAPLGNLLTSASSAATALGSWFSAKTNEAKERAPELIEKTKVLSKDVFNRTKTLTLEAYDKASDAAKKAGTAVEGFVEKTMQEHGFVAAGEGNQDALITSPSSNPEGPSVPKRDIPLAE
jgi:hypothetical protein